MCCRGMVIAWQLADILVPMHTYLRCRSAVAATSTAWEESRGLIVWKLEFLGEVNWCRR